MLEPSRRVPQRPLMVAAVTLAVSLTAFDEPHSEVLALEPAPLADPASTLEMLSVDPLTRAHAATYEAALLFRPGSVTYPSATATAVAAGLNVLGKPPAKGMGKPRVSAEVARAIDRASQATGVSRTYLWRSAARESSLDPTASAPSSSARGLFQFVEETWLATIQRHGAKHGLLPRGRQVSKADLLRLRFDPEASARMAAELAKDNRATLEAALGRQANDSDLYLAHFLGSGGAVRLIAAAGTNPSYPASSLFPDAARANPSIFYAQGRALSVRDLVETLRLA